MTERAQRPFWLHQFAEYVIGIALIVAGFQDPEPVVPALAGVLVLINTAIVNGPFGAFRFVSRRVHRWLDVVVVAILLFAVVQPWAPVSFVGRGTLALICIPLGFIWWFTDWAERPSRRERRTARGSKKSDDVGRSAGRIAGRGWRNAKAKIDQLGDDS